MRKLIPLLLLCALLGACSHKPTQDQMIQGDYGEVPSTYSSLIINQLKDTYIGPRPARIEVAKPFPAVRRRGLNHAGTYEYGHVVQAWILTKDDEGQFTQRSPRIFWWGNTGWSTMLPSLEGVIPKYPEQAEEYIGMTYTRF